MSLKANKRRSRIVILAPLATAAFMTLVWTSEYVGQLENMTLDRRFRSRVETDPPPDPRIALIGIGKESLRLRGKWGEWTRDIFAEFTGRIATYRPPKVLAFDIFFSEESRENPDGDLLFADALSTHPASITGMFIDADEGMEEKPPPPDEFYLGEKTFPLTQVSGDRTRLLGSNSATLPIPPIAESALAGVVNCPPSPIDKMRREMPLVARLGDKIYPSFVLQILMQLEETTPDAVKVNLGESITLPKKDGGEWRIPINERGFMAINYRNTDRFRMSDFIMVSDQLEKSGDTGPWPASLPVLFDQIVIVGQAAEGLQDLGPTPYLALDYLFRVQATALDNILQNDYLLSASRGSVIGGWLLITWCTLIGLRRAPVTLEIVLPLFMVAAYEYAGFHLFRSHSLALPLVLPVAGFILVHATVVADRLISELREKRYIKGVFGSYVSPEVVKQIIDSGETPKLGGERVDITILFSDIQGFSSFSEELSPEQLVELMVEYLSAMTDIITDEGGSLDKYIGDAIVAMYGVPLPLPGHAYRGVYSTILMQRKQSELREQWRAEGRSGLVRGMRTRIGLNTGPAVVGNMGSQRRFNYTMMGDNVNLGARCESGAKSYGVYTMITGETRDAARLLKDDIVYRFLDQIIVKGRTLPVKVYEVIEHEGQVDQATYDCLSLYTVATDLYLAQNWKEAIVTFEKAAALERFQPGAGIATNPSLLMAARCKRMRLSPPGEDWDGIYKMTDK